MDSLSMDDPHEWLTQRAAAQQLHEDLGLHPETARRLLVAGLVGPPRTTSLASFHRRDVLDDFVSSHWERRTLPQPDRNLVLVRIGNGRVKRGATQQRDLDRLADGWRMSPKWRALCRAVVASGGNRPGFVVMLSGFVVAGADIVGAEWSGAECSEARPSPLMTRFELRPPGPWFDEWRGRLIPTGRGGSTLRFWALHASPPWERTPRDRTARRRSLG